MAQKNNIRGIRFSDELAELIDRQVGRTFTEKFENLVTRCVWELPGKEAELERLNKEISRLKKLAILFALTLCVVLAGCNQPAPPQGGEPSEPQETPEVDVIITEPEEPTPPTDEQTATLYIGTKAGGFNEYPMTYDGDLTAEKMIQGIADLTGWDLTLVEDVISGKGGMSVCLSSESSLFTGPPDPQREEFHVYDVGQLAETILDSIQKTLQEGFTGEGGNPDTLDIWYYMEGDQPLELPILGLSWPIDQPYQWAGAETE